LAIPLKATAMHIGIVTPAYNIAPYLGDAVRSVLAQTHHDWSMTIVDDGSADGTADIAREIPDRRIRIVRQSNAGVSAARNNGLAQTSADAVLFLDGDDWLSPDALLVLSRALRDDSKAIAAVGRYARVAIGGPLGRASPPPSGDLLQTLLVRNLFANGGHLLIRRAALAAAGLFRADLRYGEDWEYWTRLARHGLFVAAPTRAPLLYVRERHDSAYRAMATRPESFAPCMGAIFGDPALLDILSASRLADLRSLAEAENHWIIGRELIRHGQRTEGRGFLLRSLRTAPTFKRMALVLAELSPYWRIRTFRPYPATGSI
jgi:glycosyltransferase involved in cell wall biosynthesis